MRGEILNHIPVSLDLEKILKGLHLSKESEQLRDIQELIEIAYSLIDPKAIYEVSYVENKNTDTVDIDGVKFTSRVLRKNLDKVGRVFPYVVTIGEKLEDRVSSFDDLTKQYYLDTIATIALSSSERYLENYLKRKYRLGQLSKMNPGSLEDWPITQQLQLFSILDSVEESIGVRLTENFLMIPRKSISGIFFPTEVMFHSCQLCPREGCVGRKAPYDRDLAEKYMKVKLG